MECHSRKKSNLFKLNFNEDDGLEVAKLEEKFEKMNGWKCRI